MTEQKGGTVLTCMERYSMPERVKGAQNCIKWQKSIYSLGDLKNNSLHQGALAVIDFFRVPQRSASDRSVFPKFPVSWLSIWLVMVKNKSKQTAGLINEVTSFTLSNSL